MAMDQDQEMTDVSEHARALAARRRRVARTCAVCGTPIAGIAIRRYCSDACRSAAYRRRLGAEYNARRRQSRRARRTPPSAAS